jgi:hypothetical protein
MTEMTNREWERFDYLSDKMESAREKAGRSFTTTDDLTVPERAEWHALNVKVDRVAQEYQAREERRYADSQLSALLYGMDDQGSPYPRTDADMGL